MCIKCPKFTVCISLNVSCFTNVFVGLFCRLLEEYRKGRPGRKPTLLKIKVSIELYFHKSDGFEL